jgi:hypothetical protein
MEKEEIAEEPRPRPRPLPPGEAVLRPAAASGQGPVRRQQGPLIRIDCGAGCRSGAGGGWSTARVCTHGTWTSSPRRRRLSPPPRAAAALPSPPPRHTAHQAVAAELVPEGKGRKGGGGGAGWSHGNVAPPPPRKPKGLQHRLHTRSQCKNHRLAPAKQGRSTNT